MKRTIVTIFLLCVVCCLHAQNTKTFDCELFSLEYPDSYTAAPIQNAPHMVLKLERGNAFFSASYWDKEFEPGTDIWDDEFVEMYENMPVQNGEMLSVTRETLYTKGGNVKCIKAMTNVHKKFNGQTINLKLLSYAVIKDEYLLVFTFCDNGQYKYGEKTPQSDNLMKGLKFKDASSSQEDYKSQLLEVVKDMNSLCPIQSDDCTTVQQVLLSGKTIMIKALVLTGCYEFVEYNDLKEAMAQSYSFAFDKPFVKYLKREGYGIAYMIYDEKQKLKKRLSITADDILAYYNEE